MLNRIILLISMFLILIIPNKTCAQTINHDSSTVNEKTANVDSVLQNKIILKSPRTAMIRSLIFPGLGQAYNEKEFKAFVFFGAEFGLLMNSVYLNHKSKKSVNSDEKEFYIENRNSSTWWLVGVLLFSVLDAYVDAHLYYFDESPDLSVIVNPSYIDKSWRISCSVSF